MTNTDYIDYMDLDTIRMAWDKGAYHCNLTVPQKVSPNYVFDENLSVKRNREMVEEHNANVERLKEEKWHIQGELSRKLTNDVVEYLMGTYDFTRKQAERVQSYVYTEKHSFMGDYFSAIDEIADMVRDVLDAK